MVSDVGDLCVLDWSEVSVSHASWPDSGAALRHTGYLVPYGVP